MVKYFLEQSHGLYKIGKEENGTKWYLARTKWFCDYACGTRYTLETATRKISEMKGEKQ